MMRRGWGGSEAVATPPLKPLHRDEQLIKGKLDKFDKVSTEDLIASLKPARREV